MGNLQHFDPPAEAILPLPPALALVMGGPKAPRSAIEAIIEGMITALDTLDGDPDVELNGDEHEDSECLQPWIDARGQWAGAAPTLAPLDCEDDEGEEPNVPDFGIDQTAPAIAPPMRDSERL